jgi:hypothetical protein
LLIRINSPAFAPFGGTIGRHLTTIASGFRRVCLPGTRSGTPAYGTCVIYCVCRTHTHTHTRAHAGAHQYATPGHICVYHVCTITIGRHLTTIASGFRRVCLPGTRSGTPAYRTHTGLTREWVSSFRPFRLLTRVLIYCVCRTHLEHMRTGRA